MFNLDRFQIRHPIFITTYKPEIRKIYLKILQIMPKLHIKVTKSDIYLKLYYLVVFIRYMKMLTNDK